MTSVMLSEGERTYIFNGIQEDFRTDCRSRMDYRPMQLEVDVLTNTNGSARLKLAATDVLVGVKTEIIVPDVENPEEGSLEFFVDCSANASIQFEGRGGEDLATQIAFSLRNAYRTPTVFNLKKLCILPKYQSWKLCVDVLILQCGGNLYDAVSMAVKAALYCTRIPRVSCALMDGGAIDLTLTDDPYDFDRIIVDSLPILVTLCKIGDHIIIDPTAEEESCSSIGIIVGISRSPDIKITTMKTIGSGSLHPDTMNECVKLGITSSQYLNDELMRVLKVNEKKNPLGLHGQNLFGFLN